MRLRRLRKECEARLSGLAVPRPFDVRAFCEQVAQWRGRPLHLHELPVEDAADLPCGMWIATDRADHVFHVPGGSSLHRDHIVLHELGHMLFDHAITAEPAGEPDALDRLLPDLDPAMVRRVLRRGGYSSEQEQAAEMLASLILQRAATPAPGGLGDVFGHARRVDAGLTEPAAQR
ncbi:hypothetical protein HDA40_006008 [Hamadaea flava]|uniref:Regulator component n=1 Tax=Hamadaea flava TaxID=1742688 RepID=A0ABV8LW68_9ACTN|nr:hypothetical protein [Hamadaea flava]MCP2327501.1 hypothetical protein [Hamadaea flava]